MFVWWLCTEFLRRKELESKANKQNGTQGGFYSRGHPYDGLVIPYAPAGPNVVNHGNVNVITHSGFGDLLAGNDVNAVDVMDNSKNVGGNAANIGPGNGGIRDVFNSGRNVNVNGNEFCGGESRANGMLFQAVNDDNNGGRGGVLFNLLSSDNLNGGNGSNLNLPALHRNFNGNNHGINGNNDASISNRNVLQGGNGYISSCM